MENKQVGYLLIGVSILVIFVIFLFNSALKDIVAASCEGEHGLSCPMTQTVNQQTYLALGIVGLLVIVAIVLIVSKPQKEVIIKTKTIHKKKSSKKIDISELRNEDKEVFKIIKEQKTIFQADLIEKTDFGKAKMTRILDRLEGKGFVERKRRGMTNVVVLVE